MERLFGRAVWGIAPAQLATQPDLLFLPGVREVGEPLALFPAVASAAAPVADHDNAAEQIGRDLDPVKASHVPDGVMASQTHTAWFL